MWTYRHGIHDTHDVHQHAASLALWDQRYEQLSGGAFHGRIEELQIGPAQVFREQTDRAVLQQCLPRPNTLTLAVALHSSGDSWFCGRALRPGEGLVLISDAEFEFVTYDHFDVLALDIDRDHLTVHARALDGIELDAGTLPTHVRHSPGADTQALSALLLDTLRTAREAAPLLQHAAMRRALVHTACDLLLAQLHVPEPTPVTLTVASRQAVVRAAREYMRAHAQEALGVPELCTALGVSRRTLQYSFQDVLQLSPVSYLRALRLNGVRRELSASAVDSVADCAARWGFWHLGRFASEYRELFGERPSQTLQRCRLHHPCDGIQPH
jgi:AraC family ethanolamine operon transcriptional activator